MFGHKLRLEREISTVQGQNNLMITDKITNFGFKPSPYTILYHMNMGYPLLNEDAELIINPVKTTPRDIVASTGLKEFNLFSKPQAGYSEQVFCHTMQAVQENKTFATLQNRKLGIALTIKFDMTMLPYLIQWKMMGQGEYVLGLEPSNVTGKNRKQLKDENSLPYINPGESTTNCIEIFLNAISQPG